MTSELLELFSSHPVVCRHVHIPLQSGSDRVLQRMRRGYTSGEFRAIVEKLRAQVPQVAITTDIMVGFPEKPRRISSRRWSSPRRWPSAASMFSIIPGGPEPGRRVFLNKFPRR